MQLRSGLRTGEARVPQGNERSVAQAVELVRALRDQLRQMTDELVRLERLRASGKSCRASAIRYEAAVLRRDINEAQAHIDLLQLRYLNDNGHPSRSYRNNRRRSAAQLQWRS